MTSDHRTYALDRAVQLPERDLALEKSIGIMIPTINRSKYLKGALDFYLRSTFGGTIYIGDSSSGAEKETVKELCEQYETLGLTIKAYSFPAIHDGEVINIVNTYIEPHIKYLAYAGDDDFLIPLGLNYCAQFLEKNPEYVAAHGHRANFIIEETKPKLVGMKYGYDWDVTTTPSTRWIEYMRTGIAIANYLHRKDVWQAKYSHARHVRIRYLGPELLPESLMAIAGPIKYLDYCVSYLFYQNNPDRIFSFDKHSLWELINDPQWLPSLDILRTVLHQHLPIELIEQELWLHIMTVLHVQYMGNFGAPGDFVLNKKLEELDSSVLYPQLAGQMQIVKEVINA